MRLLRFIDWLIHLPKPLELARRQALAELEEQTQMSDVTSWGQFAREEGYTFGMEAGRREGWRQGRQHGEARTLLRLLEVRFGPLLAEALARVCGALVGQLEVWLTRIPSAERLEQGFDVH